MRQSVLHLEKFYASRLGRLTNIMVMRRLQNLWPELPGRNILGLGYTHPFMQPYISQAKSAALAMPAAQGAVVMRSERGVISTLVHDDQLPFADASFDNVFIAHAIEEAVDVSRLLKEVWRVTMPEGRIVMIAAHRKGLWAQFDKTPFGYGRPFSRSQLRRALEEAGFVSSLGAGVLYAPPFNIFARPKLSLATERLGETIWPSLSGLIMVEAVKRLYAEQDRGAAERVKRAKISGTALPGIQPTPMSGTIDTISQPVDTSLSHSSRHHAAKSS